MNLNPRIKTSFLWFVLTLAACVCFAAAIFIQAGVLCIVALPVLLLVPYLSGMAAINELSPEISCNFSRKTFNAIRRFWPESRFCVFLPP